MNLFRAPWWIALLGLLALLLVAARAFAAGSPATPSATCFVQDQLTYTTQGVCCVAKSVA